MVSRVTILCCLLLTTAAFSQPERTAGEAFDEAYSLLSAADEARDQQKAGDATELYRRAVAAYEQLSERYPEWRREVVQFRIIYCRDQIDALQRRFGESSTAPSQEPTDEPPLHPAELTAEDKDIPSLLMPSLPDALAEMLNVARRLITSGENAKARTYLLEGLKLNPDHAEVRLLLGIAQCQAEEYQDALFLLSQLVEEFPDYAEAHVALAAAQTGTGRLDEAIQSLRTALRLRPEMQQAHYDLAQLLLAADNGQEALAAQHYRHALSLGGEPDEALEAQLEGISTNVLSPAAAFEPTNVPSATPQ